LREGEGAKIVGLKVVVAAEIDGRPLGLRKIGHLG
jgi:hypothetical protein